MWLIWPNQKFQELLLLYGSWNAVNKQYISQFWFLKLTKQINCPSEYMNIKFFWRGDLQWGHFPGHSFPVRNDISHAEQELQ